MGSDDENKQAILARRACYIAMAVAGISTATSATACVCLQPLHGPDASGPDASAGSQPDAAGDAPTTDANREDSAPVDSDAP
jgi:hypothetical protein